jgi:hypothetical protein
MRAFGWEEHQRLVERGFTTDLDFWLFSNVAEGAQEWRDLRQAIGSRTSCRLYRVAKRGTATFIKGPSNTLVLESEAMRIRLLDRLCPAKWHTVGSLDGKGEGDCRTDH